MTVFDCRLLRPRRQRTEEKAPLVSYMKTIEENITVHLFVIKQAMITARQFDLISQFKADKVLQH